MPAKRTQKFKYVCDRTSDWVGKKPGVLYALIMIEDRGIGGAKVFTKTNYDNSLCSPQVKDKMKGFCEDLLQRNEKSLVKEEPMEVSVKSENGGSSVFGIQTQANGTKVHTYTRKELDKMPPAQESRILRSGKLYTLEDKKRIDEKEETTKEQTQQQQQQQQEEEEFVFSESSSDEERDRFEILALQKFCNVSNETPTSNDKLPTSNKANAPTLPPLIPIQTPHTPVGATTINSLFNRGGLYSLNSNSKLTTLRKKSAGLPSKRKNSIESLFSIPVWSDIEVQECNFNFFSAESVFEASNPQIAKLSFSDPFSKIQEMVTLIPIEEQWVWLLEKRDGCIKLAVPVKEFTLKNAAGMGFDPSMYVGVFITRKRPELPKRCPLGGLSSKTSSLITPQKPTSQFPISTPKNNVFKPYSTGTNNMRAKPIRRKRARPSDADDEDIDDINSAKRTKGALLRSASTPSTSSQSDQNTIQSKFPSVGFFTPPNKSNNNLVYPLHPTIAMTSTQQYHKPLPVPKTLPNAAHQLQKRNTIMEEDDPRKTLCLKLFDPSLDAGDQMRFVQWIHVPWNDPHSASFLFAIQGYLQKSDEYEDGDVTIGDLVLWYVKRNVATQIKSDSFGKIKYEHGDIVVAEIVENYDESEEQQQQQQQTFLNDNPDNNMEITEEVLSTTSTHPIRPGGRISDDESQSTRSVEQQQQQKEDQQNNQLGYSLSITSNNGVQSALSTPQLSNSSSIRSNWSSATTLDGNNGTTTTNIPSEVGAAKGHKYSLTDDEDESDVMFPSSDGDDDGDGIDLNNKQQQHVIGGVGKSLSIATDASISQTSNEGNMDIDNNNNNNNNKPIGTIKIEKGYNGLFTVTKPSEESNNDMIDLTGDGDGDGSENHDMCDEEKQHQQQEMGDLNDDKEEGINGKKIYKPIELPPQFSTFHDMLEWSKNHICVSFYEYGQPHNGRCANIETFFNTNATKEDLLHYVQESYLHSAQDRFSKKSDLSLKSVINRQEWVIREAKVESGYVWTRTYSSQIPMIDEPLKNLICPERNLDFQSCLFLVSFERRKKKMD